MGCKGLSLNQGVLHAESVIVVQPVPVVTACGAHALVSGWESGLLCFCESHTILLVKESGRTLPKCIRGDLWPGGRYLSGGVSCPQNHNDIRFLRGEPF
jgi:hypothetical protein